MKSNFGITIFKFGTRHRSLINIALHFFRWSSFGVPVKIFIFLFGLFTARCTQFVLPSWFERRSGRNELKINDTFPLLNENLLIFPLMSGCLSAIYLFALNAPTKQKRKMRWRGGIKGVNGWRCSTSFASWCSVLKERLPQYRNRISQAFSWLSFNVN